jgi:hypothetical protein
VKPIVPGNSFGVLACALMPDGETGKGAKINSRMYKDETPKIEDTTEKFLRLLEEEFYRHEVSPKEVRRLVQNFFPGKEGEILAEKVLEEGYKKAIAALDGFWQALKAPPLPVAKELLWKGVWMSFRYPKALKDSQRGLLVEALGDKRDTLELPLPDGPSLGPLRLDVQIGRVEVETASGVFARRGRAFVRTDDVHKALEDVRALRPLFVSMGLGDLESAIEALVRLGDGEVRMEGPYLLARKASLRVLRRGLMLGEPHLDGALLLGEEVNLSFPREVDMGFKARFGAGQMLLDKLWVRWGEETLFLGEGIVDFYNLLDENPLAKTVRNRARASLEDAQSAKMRSLLKVLAQHENPIELLKSGEFYPESVMELFSEL